MQSGSDGGEKLDEVLEYASEVLTLGLFLLEFVEATCERDGDCICKCWQFFLHSLQGKIMQLKPSHSWHN